MRQGGLNSVFFYNLFELTRAYLGFTVESLNVNYFFFLMRFNRRWIFVFSFAATVVFFSLVFSSTDLAEEAFLQYIATKAREIS